MYRPNILMMEFVLHEHSNVFGFYIDFVSGIERWIAVRSGFIININSTLIHDIHMKAGV